MVTYQNETNAVMLSLSLAMLQQQNVTCIKHFTILHRTKWEWAWNGTKRKFNPFTLHIKWRLPIKISSVNVTQLQFWMIKLCHIYWRNPKWKTWFFVHCSTQIPNFHRNYHKIYTIFSYTIWNTFKNVMKPLQNLFQGTKKWYNLGGIILVIVFVALFSNSRQQIHGRKHCFQILTNKYTVLINILKNT